MSEIVVIGGGIIGLAIAIELKLRGLGVMILNQKQPGKASPAAAGMLAPQAEGLTGLVREFGLESRRLYGPWTEKITELSGLPTGYFPCGIVAPVTAPNRQLYGLNTDPAITQWLDRSQLDQVQPHLGAAIVGAWWYPEDGQVNPRQLLMALETAATNLQIPIHHGVKVQAIAQSQGQVTHLETNQGNFHGEGYVLANGAWCGQLLPLPVRPLKGQMVALSMATADHQNLPIPRVIFGDGIYLVPRPQGRLVIGATSEEVGWQDHNRPQGFRDLLQGAIALYPPLQDWPMEEMWWGYRPATPDELPILGASHCKNLYLATGHYRNGILFAPITAALLGDLIAQGVSDRYLDAFSYQRFSANFTMPHLATAAFTPPMPPSQPAHPNGQQPAPGHSQTPDLMDNGEDPLVIAGKTFHSRLMTGTGKYPSMDTMQQTVEASGCQIVTVAVRRVQTNAPGHEGLAEALDWQNIWMLPNTAGCKDAEEAVRVARLGREMAKLLGQEDNNFIKLEVIPDPKYLLPDPIGTLQAAEQLVKEGFAVLPYINADPLLAKRLEEVGCATVMPLGSPIGSGQGIKNEANIRIIIEQSQIPVVIDAGIGSPSEAALGMELGADALLINSAIALAKNPVSMGRAMGLATTAGRLAYQAGRIPVKSYASASSPLTGKITD